MSKIIEKIIEPSKVEIGSIFKIKIKTIRYLTYAEIKNQKISKLKNVTIAEMKGD